MKLQDYINFSKYKRFFAFGCSFTDYKWPMWPEIISHNISNFYNYGCAGSDNRLIFLRILEADSIYNFNEDDLIIVMWTNIWRDTVFDPNVNWQLLRINDNNLIFKQLNFIFRDFCFFKSIHNFLENKKADYDFLSISGYSLDLFKNFHLFQHTDDELKEVEKLINLFSSTLTQLKLSMFETVYEKNWQPTNNSFSCMINSEGKKIIDNHPTPYMSLKYLETIYPNNNFYNAYEYVKNYQNKIVNEIISERIHPHNQFESILLKAPLISK